MRSDLNLIPDPTNQYVWDNFRRVADWSRTKNPGFTTVPESPSAVGTVGQMATDGDYLYVCVGQNDWKRTALSTW